MPGARAVCPECGLVLMEERIAGGGRARLRARLRRRPVRPRAYVVTAAALVTAAAAGLVLHEAPPALTPSSEALSPAEAERLLAHRYPHLRYAEHAVIACPDRAIKPGGEARCWVLARVGLQRAVRVRLSRAGNQVRFED